MSQRSARARRLRTKRICCPDGRAAPPELGALLLGRPAGTRIGWIWPRPRIVSMIAVRPVAASGEVVCYKPV